MDSSTIALFLESGSTRFMSSRYNHWDPTAYEQIFEDRLLQSIQLYDRYPDIPPHYWSNAEGRLKQFIKDIGTYASTREELFEETLTIRKNLLTIATNIQLFGNSVITVIDSTAADTQTQNLTQTQIAEFDSSLLSPQDTGCVQSISSYIGALRDTTSSALENVSNFQKKVSDLKVHLANNVRPVTDGVLTFHYPDSGPRLISCLEEIAKNPTDEGLQEKYLTERSFIVGPLATPQISPLTQFLLLTLIDLSESVTSVQPALSKFELLWIDTCSFIKNSKDNADTINNVKMLKVFKARMQKIVKDWNSVKSNLGDQPVALE